ncbi:MAG: cobalamin-binding domain-containing protein [Syntrophobacteraceae bacterium]
MRNILLVEPSYKSKYPPLGLMKIAAYHKRLNDRVVFVKGCVPEKRAERWDRVYVSSIFTYYWRETLKAIEYYQDSVPRRADVIVGGVLATLLRDDLELSTGATVIPGLLDTAGVLDPGDRTRIDTLTPDYSILSEANHTYELQNCYIGYATRGCPNGCGFCAVHQIEPEFKSYLPLRRMIQLIEELYGKKRDLILLDNNVLASERFKDIILDIKALGFAKGATYSYRNKSGRTTTVNRYVDFNQGLDSRLLTDEKMALLSEIAIRPVRIAFDDIRLRDLYEEKVRLATKYDLKYLSNYILYNFNDRPDHFYDRLKINLDLNEELGLQIFSFPMRYVDLKCKNRLATTPGNIGKHWNAKYLRAIQCVLVRTRGLVGTKRDYFLKAFGHDHKEFHKILLMPDSYIIYRFKHEGDGSTDLWWSQVCALSDWEYEIFEHIVCNQLFRSVNHAELPRGVREALTHYMVRDDRGKPKIDENSVQLAV